MGKVLISLRFDTERLAELDKLADVYTNGNRTELLQRLVRQMYFLEPLALYGKYRTPGFGVNGRDRERFVDAWNVWMCNINSDFVYTCRPRYHRPIDYDE